MPVFMSTCCLLITTAIVTWQCIPKPHSTTTARWRKGTKEGSLCSSSGCHSLYKVLRKVESDHGTTKHVVLVLKYNQSWIWPLCVAIPSCHPVILALPADAKHGDTLQMGWSMSGAASVLAGRSSFTWLIQLLAILLWWTYSELPGLQKVHFILLYEEQQVHRPHLLFPRTSHTANLGKVKYSVHTRAKHVFITFAEFLISPSFFAQMWKITTPHKKILI